MRCISRFTCDDTESGRLYRTVGKKMFEKLQREFGGRRIWVPKPGTRLPCGVCEKRLECIRTWRRKGHSAARIAKDLGVSGKTVYRLLNI